MEYLLLIITPDIPTELINLPKSLISLTLRCYKPMVIKNIKFPESLTELCLLDFSDMYLLDFSRLPKHVTSLSFGWSGAIFVDTITQTVRYITLKKGNYSTKTVEEIREKLPNTILRFVD